MQDQAKLYSKINRGQLIDGEALLQHAAPRTGDLVLDVGCGTGELTFELARKVGASGRVVALDPDADRVSIAQQTQPSDIKNIEWICDEFSTEAIASRSNFDLVFSSHVFHWFSDQQDGVMAVSRALRPGGRFAIQFVYALPACLALIRKMVKQEIDLPEDLRDRWLSYFDQAGFQYEIKTDIEPYFHPDLNDLLAWYEGTTHGVVRRDNLTPDNLRLLESQYPGEINVAHPTLRLVGCK